MCVLQLDMTVYISGQIIKAWYRQEYIFVFVLNSITESIQLFLTVQGFYSNADGSNDINWFCFLKFMFK